MKRLRSHLCLSLILGFLISPSIYAQQLKPVMLPKPQLNIGRPLMEVLKDRKTSRDFSPEKLAPQVLSNLLWAGFGINRPDGHRTAPSAMNWQEIDIYVVTADAAYVYDAKANALNPVASGDFRAQTGGQAFVKDAPVNLVYVADLAKAKRANADDQKMYTAADAGFISQNVYLYCASEGLATVVRGSVDRPALAKALNLRPDQIIVLAQTVGYPKK